ncbi:MAG: DUF1801 domain-containing protein [bacterium]|nr:DUF1801 domain-containing protein [bacterium]
MAPTKKYYKVEDYIVDLPQWMQERLFVVREIILHAHPNIKENVKYNIPFYSLNGLLFYFAIYKKKHFVLGMCNGAKLPDMHHQLMADAKQKFIRHWPFIETKEPNYDLLAQYIDQSVELNLKERAFSNVKAKN